MDISKNILTSTALLTLLATNSVLAEAPISDAYTPGESHSKWILGGTAAIWENPYINEGDDDDDDVDDGEYDGEFIPRIEYRGERFFADEAGIGVTVFRSNGFSTGVILSGNGTYLSDEDDYDDNDRLIGIKERDPTADLGIYLIHTHDQGQLRLSAWQEITHEHDGQSFDARYSYNFPISERWNITPVVGLSWASEDAINHFYGVSEEESLASNGIATYEGENTTSFYGGVNARFDINEHWDIHFGAAAVSFGDGIKDSPLIEDNDTLVSSFGVNYNF